MKLFRIARSLLLTLFLLLIIYKHKQKGDQRKTTNSTSESVEVKVSTLTTKVPPNGDGLSVGKSGDIYISGGPEGKKVSRVTPAGDVSTFATGFKSANGSDFDSKGNLYVADYRGNSVRKITPDGKKSTFSSDLDGPAGIYVDHKDNVIVSLFGAGFSGEGETVLSISPDGKISQLAVGDGLSDVIGLAGDEKGRIFAANWRNGQLFEITGGKVTPFVKTDNRINQIEYSDGYIYLPSPLTNKILRVDLDGNIEEIAGTGEAGSSDGPGSTATFNRPNSCGLSPDGKILYIYDANSGYIRKLLLQY